MKPRTAERLHLAFLFATAALLVQTISYKFGFRGKFHPWETSTSWSDVAAEMPIFIVISLAIAGIVYFWPRH
jgi:hypothetical protein